MIATIIIPTYNRAKILKKCLDALKEQTFKDFEIIIVDDGSTDETMEVIKKTKELKIKYIYQTHSQQGTARNKGLLKAKGKYIFFIGDDIIPKEDWIEEHLKYHKRSKNMAVLGLTLWSKDIKKNDFMDYLAPNGPQFNYGKIKNENNCGWDFFWTSNISIEKINLRNERFDENFKGWGYEDLELGYRLGKKGTKIHFNPNAIAYHHHYYEFPDEFLKKQSESAKSALYFSKKHPELRRFLIENNEIKFKHKIILIFFKIFPIFRRIKKLKIILWKLKRREYFSRGLNEDNTN